MNTLMFILLPAYQKLLMGMLHTQVHVRTNYVTKGLRLNIIHSFSSLPHDRAKTSSEASSPHSAI
jgi:hypothetical protein